MYKRGRRSNLVDYRRVQKVKINDIEFDSAHEGRVYVYLIGLEKLGELENLEVKPTVYLTAARIRMIPDFAALDTRTGERVFYEAKGMETPVWRLKRRLWLHGYGHGDLHVYKPNGRGIYLSETIKVKKNMGEDISGNRGKAAHGCAGKD